MERRVRRRFAAVLALIAVGAFTFRVVYTVFGTARPDKYIYDSAFYKLEAATLADGKGFVQLNFASAAPAEPAADHPPLYPVVLTPVAWLTHSNDLDLRLLNCALGALGVALIGLLGRELAGDTAGLIAAGAAALYPNLWVNDGLVMSESLAVVIVVASVLVALRVLRKPTLGRVAALAVLAGLGALARSELALLFPVLCVPAVVVGYRSSGRAMLRPLVIAALVVGAVVGPWVGYNLSRFQKPVFVSTNFDLNLLGSSCPEVMRGPNIGNLGFCVFSKRPSGADQSVVAVKMRAQAFRYIRQNLSRYPEVVLARIGRTWSLYRPLDGLAGGLAEGRPRWVTGLGLICYYPLLALALAGVWVRRRRREILWPLLVVPAVVTLSMLVSYGQVRYRVICEPFIVVLAASFAASFVSGRRRTLLPPTRDPVGS